MKIISFKKLKEGQPIPSSWIFFGIRSTPYQKVAAFLFSIILPHIKTSVYECFDNACYYEGDLATRIYVRFRIGRESVFNSYIQFSKGLYEVGNRRLLATREMIEDGFIEKPDTRIIV